MVKVYKVLRRKTTDNQLYSCNTPDAYDWDSEWVVQYEKDKWVKPKVANTKLYVFSTLEAAQEWARNEGRYTVEVWECHTKKTYKCVLATGFARIAQFWKLRLGHKKYSHLIRNISDAYRLRNAVAVDSLKLVKKVGW